MKRTVPCFCPGSLSGLERALVSDRGPHGRAQKRQLSLVNRVRTGDFDKLLERRMIRVLVPNSRSLYFNDRGRERGLAPNVNQKYKTGRRLAVGRYFI